MAFQARHRFILSRVTEAFGLEEGFVEGEMRKEENATRLAAFFRADGPPRVFAYYQRRDAVTEDGEATPGEGEPEFFLTDGQGDALRGRAIYFMRVPDPSGRDKDLDPTRADDGRLAFGVVNRDVLTCMEAFVGQVYRPMLLSRQDWGKADRSSVSEFTGAVNKLVDGLDESIKSLHSGLKLRRPDKRFEVEKRPFAELVGDAEALMHFAELLESWCDCTEQFLDETEQARAENGEAGPETELEYWRRRMQQLTSITEQLKAKGNKTVVSALSAASKGGGGAAAALDRQQVAALLRRWKEVDLSITEAANEAKDNVRYLATLEKFFTPLYEGTPDQVADSLPGLLNSIKMIHTIARHYNTTERMTGLFVKISNQMITNCKRHINGRDPPDEVWEKEPEALLERLEACLKLNEQYQEQYRITKEKLLATPKGKQFDFSEAQIFGKFDLFCRRVIKLIDMFSTIHQFRALREHSLEGMEHLLQTFDHIIAEFQDKRHDLLDYHNNKFDRDYVEFNVRVSDLEASLQRFINQSFESISSIDQSLAMLRRFQSLIQRDSLKQDLDSKFMAIFHRFGMDLGTISEIYEKYKHVPPVPRNMPPVAGNIMWARHLLKRVEGPMKKFSAYPAVLESKESRKIIKTYNKVARTLVAFEYLWYEEWCKSIDKSKAGLQATLIVRHPESGKLFVNFDPEILQLNREAKCLDRLGIDIPDGARMVLLQEDKFKSYYEELSYLLGYYDQLVRRILPSCAVLLRPHVADLEFKLRPGMITLTWTSMNIDAFKQHVQGGLQKLEALISSVNDIIENRINKNLKLVSNTLLVDLPADKSMLLEEFVALQEQHVKARTAMLQAKNQEVENAVEDVFNLITAYPLDPHVGEVDPGEVQRVKAKYNNLFFQAMRNCTSKSLHALKARVCSRAGSGVLFLERPFFEVAVQLAVPSVSLNPSLDDIQRTTNKAALAVLRCSQMVADWGQSQVPRARRRSFFDRIGRDIEIVRVVLLLTGGVQGTRNQVATYLATFHKYDWLWKEDKEQAYRRFMQTDPAIEDFERELRRFVAVEEEIDAISPLHNIGALSLNTKNLKLQLGAECRDWKVQYSRRVHEKARGRMEELLEYIRATTAKLQREVQDLDGLRFAMEVLREVRERESSIDMVIMPIVEMYDMLDRFLPAGFMTQEEMDKRSVMRASWRRLVEFAEEVADKLSGIQGSFKRQLMKDVRAFAQDCAQFRKDYVKNGPARPGLKPAEAVESLRRFKAEFEIRERKMEVYQAGEDLFALPKTEYPELMQTKKELELLDMLYTLYMDVVTTMEEYQSVAWSEVVSSVGDMTERVASFDARCRKLPSRLREWEAFNELRQLITQFNEVLPLLQELSKPSIRPRHWQELEEITGQHFPVEEDFKLKVLLDAELHLYTEDIEEVAEGADKQLSIEQKLKEDREKWATFDVSFGQWQNRKVPVLKGHGGVLEELEESILQMQTLLSMRHVGPFKDAVSQRFVELGNTAETLERWVRVQQLWMSLESVFTGGDIAKQMPLEAKKFSKIDKEFSRLMHRAAETRNVVACCSNEVLKTALPSLYEELEKCQKSLEGYLEQKRQKFPRFYFVSNPVLLQILSQGSDPQAVQPYYEKLFDSVNRAVHDRRDKGQIVELKSIQGSDEEVVPLTKAVRASGNIEDWLASLEGEMQRTMKDICRQCARDSEERELRELVDSYCGQFALLGLQFKWTGQVQSALMRCKQGKAPMVEAMKAQQEVLRQLSAWCLGDLGSAMRRVKYETLVTIQVHQVEVFQHLMRLFRERRLSDDSDFEWLKQSRFYWRSDQEDRHGRGTCLISITDVDFKYQYEYLGCKERLVITPLTDRCYITLAQALGMHLGGAPAGPAGTGKTETVKDMGRSLGIYVVVTNCTDQQRKDDLAKILKGLCQGGLWGCFDEFNRILLPVLSVVAQQVLAITAAKRASAATVSFPGEPDPLQFKSNAGVFITMNPGYQGRQELPENLKALFRTVAMMVPERETIMRVKLSAVGYDRFEALAKKFRALYRLCEEQLSKQKHYDFGLRNILSVLRTAGKTKRENPEEEEEVLLYRTLRDMNLSKLVAQDVPLFLSLLKDLFPKVADPPAREFPALQQALRDVVQRQQLEAHPPWVAKVMQLYETMLVRHGVMVVGPSGGGKSTIFRVLAAALAAVTNVPHKLAAMNPKAIRAEEMFGETEKSSGEWLDGVFAAMWAKFNDRARKVVQFLICDGPIDTLWIENLNTVLDDNRILTLANGDRIPMTDNVKLMFEVQNLRNASPATVSRAGIIYVSAEDLDWLPLATSWTRQQAEYLRDPLRALFRKYVGDNSPTDPGDLFRWMARHTAPMMATSRVAAVSGLISLLATLLHRSHGAISDVPSTMEAQLERLFLYSLSWGVGGLLDAEDRGKFDEWLRTRVTPAAMQGQPTGRTPLPLAEEGGTVFEYYVEDGTLAWREWKAPAWEYPDTPKLDFARLLVPTMDSTRATHLMAMLHGQRRPVLLVGGHGTAKTSTALMLFEQFDAESMLLKKVHFSALTTPRMFQETVEGEMDKRGGRSFGPPQSKQMTVFLDDLSMPERNEWGDQPTLENVRQLIEMGGFCFLDKDKRGDFKILEGLSYVAAMNEPGGGRNDIPDRLKRHFFAFSLPVPSETSIDNIYGQMLRGHFTARTVPGPVSEMAQRLTGMTVKLWAWAKKVYLPTPTKFHYVFSMRELSRVFQGVFRAGYDVVQDETALVALWRHECMRVFCDKLTTSEDKQRFLKELNEVTTGWVPRRVADSLNLHGTEEHCYFVDFLPEDDVDEDGILQAERELKYQRADSFEELRGRVEGYLEQFNSEHPAKAMRLVLFDDALRHLMRISRLLAMPRGNALLVGVGGSGKQSLTRLASFICKQQFSQITPTKTYSVSNLLEDLQGLYVTAGQYGRPVTFAFTDTQIKDETFLEHINAMLTTGEVTNLFSKDEYLVMCSELRSVAARERPGSSDTPESLAKFFIDRVRENLHIVLCMSPMHPQFAERARKFPGLTGATQIDWFLPWPQQALAVVAEGFVSDFGIECDAETKTQLMQHMGAVHTMVVETCADYYSQLRRQVYQTPKSFLSYLGSYKSLYASKLSEVQTKEGRVNLGLQKLVKGAEDVEAMKVQLREEDVKLKRAEEATNDMLGKLEVSSLEAKKENEKVEVIKDHCEGEARRISKEKADAEEDLARAKPYLEEAEQAVDSIQQSDLVELKALNKPSDVIRLVFDGVAILTMAPLAKVQQANMTFRVGRDKKTLPFIQDSYALNKAGMISDTGFLKSLFHFSQFQKDSINEETIELLKPYVELEGFTPSVARSASKAAEGLCTWVRAMVSYHEASKVVKPKLEALNVAEKRLQKAEDDLAGAEARLDKCRGVLDRLQADFEHQMAEKTRIADNAQATRQRMEQATRLIDGLGGERVRWSEDSKQFAETKRRLVGDCAVASAFLCYNGPFNQEFRALLVDSRFIRDLEERKVPLTEGLDLTAFLADAGTVGDWNMEGLPSDPLSVQNGILVTRSDRYPLLIDPQGQALAWIRNREAESMPSFGTTLLGHPKLKDQLEFAMAEGKALIITGVEQDVDPMLNPVLEKEVVRRGKSRYVSVSDKMMELHDEFRLYMTTRLPNPHFSPELQARTTVVDFAVTRKGLEEQLLGRVIQKEQKALEDQLKQVQEEVTSNTKALLRLDATLLERLTENEGNLLDDVELIGVLANTKEKATEVNAKLNAAEETKATIDEKREQFRPVATRGSVLYFAVTDMARVSPMYQTSLDQFLELFGRSMDEAEKATLASQRVNNVIRAMTYIVYRYINRGLYEQDRFSFILIIALKVLVVARRLQPVDVDTFLKGGASLDVGESRKKPVAWMSSSAWLNVLHLSRTSSFFQSLPDDIPRNEVLWRRWYEDNEPEHQAVPDYESKMVAQKEVGAFQRLQVVRTLREDRTLLAVTEFVRAFEEVEAAPAAMPALGPAYVEPVTDTIESVCAESSHATPVIFLLSAGSDPTDAVEGLARRRKQTMEAISMGEGQDVIARRVIDRAMTGGSWVLLQNCHLDLSFMGSVEEMLGKIRREGNAEFRLFITSNPHPEFPIGLLQASTKVTNEPPSGMRAGMLRSYNTMIDQDKLERIDSQSWRKLLFAMCFLHSAAQERRKFGPLGWNIPYEFNAGDLNVCLLFLEKHLYTGTISWPTVQYMIAEAIYGGKITDDMDRRLLTAYGEAWLSDTTLQPNFTFISGALVARVPHDFVYSIPDAQEVEQYRSYIASFPDVDSPEIFGLHPNADLTYRVKEATALLRAVVETMPKDNAMGTGQTREGQALEKAGELLGKLPPDYVEDDYSSRVSAMGGLEVPLNMFLFQEVQRMAVVVAYTRHTLTLLSEALRGDVVMTAQLQETLDCLVDGQPPRSWLFDANGEEVSWLSENLGSWFAGLLDRDGQLRRWLAEGRPTSFWMTGFFNPQGFLTAMRQEVTRKHAADKWAMDDVEYSTTVTNYPAPETVRSAPREGVYVHGLFLDGAGWNKQEDTLAESKPKKLFVPLPVLHVTAITRIMLRNRTGDLGPYGGYECPVYKSQRRQDRNLIFTVTLPTRKLRPSHWILRGVAILCSTV